MAGDATLGYGADGYRGPDAREAGRPPDRRVAGVPKGEEAGDRSLRVIRLRYAGTCELCGAGIAARAEAWYDSGRKKIRCLGCEPGATVPGGPARDDLADGTATGLVPRSNGVAGASAHRKYEHLSERHRERTEAAVHLLARTSVLLSTLCVARERLPCLALAAAVLVASLSQGPRMIERMVDARHNGPAPGGLGGRYAAAVRPSGVISAVPV